MSYQPSEEVISASRRRRQIAAVLAEIDDATLDELAPLISALAKKVYAWRLSHKGYVPFAVFEDLLGPVTVSVQIVHEVRTTLTNKRIGYAMKLREATEAGDAYRGLYHNTCTSFRWLDDIETALTRNNRESVGDNHPETTEYLGVTLHHETPRRNMDLTFMHRRVITESDVSRMEGSWRIFTDEEIRTLHPEIIPSNWYQTLWVMNPKRDPFGILRDTFPAELIGK